jgi:hypothetical protein
VISRPRRVGRASIRNPGDRVHAPGPGLGREPGLGGGPVARERPARGEERRLVAHLGQVLFADAGRVHLAEAVEREAEPPRRVRGEGAGGGGRELGTLEDDLARGLDPLPALGVGLLGAAGVGQARRDLLELAAATRN